jgi:hypothetical protein
MTVSDNAELKVVHLADNKLLCVSPNEKDDGVHLQHHVELVMLNGIPMERIKRSLVS